MAERAYDIIGDVHGHADQLEALLHKMGYRRHLKTWRHPERTAVFVGDLIDRGPRQLDTVEIVRHMVDAGSARIVMGNHEFNAVAWHQRDAHGEPLRSHNAVHLRQHQAFLAEIGDRPALHAELVDWFLTLPLWLALDGINVIHACWHTGMMKDFGPLLDDGARLRPALMEQAARKPAPGAGTTLFHAVEIWLKGLEAPLPRDISFLDKDRNERRKVRVRWWDDNALLYPDAALIDDRTRESLPREEIPVAARLGYALETPVFFGHYWMRGDPAAQSSRSACLDFSVANGGPLAAYRWSGEASLLPENFVSVGPATAA